MKCDFSGWATRVNRKCSDGRTIMPGAFKDDDQRTVPLVWNHSHDDPTNVLGHALLEYRPEGIYTYGFFNDTPKGQDAKQMVEHGDITGLSIYANKLKQRGSDVIHGVIREVSLVLAGANPDAFIDSVTVSHGDDYEEEGIIYFGENLFLAHADGNQNDDDDGETVEDVFNTLTEKQKNVVYALIGAAVSDAGENKIEHADEEDDSMDENMSVADVIDSMTDEQQNVMYYMIGQALNEGAGSDEDYDEEDEGVKHNVFDGDYDDNYLSHEDMQAIISDGRNLGSLREAIKQHQENGLLMHMDIDTTGMVTGTGTNTYGVRDPDMLFPDYRSLGNTPEFIQRNNGWVDKVMTGVHHSPFARIKSIFADITKDEARAKGYIKGNEKTDEVFTLLKRTTDPQTVYKKQKLDRDDVVDITDFDVLAWIRAEMRVMLDEEIARAILMGDGRLNSSDDKIKEDHVRPIAKEVPLFNTQAKVSVAANATPEVIAKAIINTALRSRKNYRGSGNPTMFASEEYITEMLLLEDGIGHKMYRTMDELATALRVKEVIPVEPMEGATITVDSAELPLIGVIVNLDDYNVGADKGGEINMFDDFDIDFNQQKYLLETRISGALTKPFSAITLVLNKAS